MIAERLYDLLPSEWPKVIGDLPSTREEVVGVIEYDGATSTEYFGPQTGSSILNPIVKIVFRTKEYEIGRQWADVSKNILHRYHDDFIMSILMVNNPIYIGRTEEKLHEFQVIFKTQIKE